MPKYDYDKYFPFSKIRPEQRKAIEFALDVYESGKRYVILEMGTGCGKSATGITIARYLEQHGHEIVYVKDKKLTTCTSKSGTYILTTQKVLQQQYVNDFGPGVGPSKNILASIKSSSNYQCGFYKMQSCADSRRTLSQLRKKIGYTKTDFVKFCQSSCEYAKEKSAFIESPISITNFSYFLTESTYTKQITPRDFLIIDECHNIESELGKFIEVTFSEKFAKEILRKELPIKITQDSLINWIQKTYKPCLLIFIHNTEKALKQTLNESSDNFSDLSKQCEMLGKHLSKINAFLEMYDADNWVMNLVKPDVNSKSKSKLKRVSGIRKFEFKPIEISGFSHDSLLRFGERLLLMSATIVDKNVFCESIGLNPNDVQFLSIPSPFPIENRPIHYIPAGSMSMKFIDKTLPSMTEAIKMLMSQHENEKGIIHCTNYKIAQYLMENIKSDRLLTHSSFDRDQVLKNHIASPKPTILLSPSMMEGVDLADDASRFQILCKIPFPYLGDIAISKRMAKNKEWYAYQTVKLIIQSMGRSVRNETDHATSYILDSDWERFYRQNRKMFPPEFSKAIA